MKVNLLKYTMKILPRNSNIYNSAVKHIMNMFHNCGLKLKTLTKDVFERKEKYIIFDGKKMRTRFAQLRNGSQ